MKSAGTIGVAVGLILALVSSAFAGSSDDGFVDGFRPVRSEPRLQAGFGFDFRIDDLDRYRYVPSVSGRFYYFFHQLVAMRAGLTFNSLTKLNGGTSYHTLALDFGLRVNLEETGISPFMESGFWLPVYWGVDRGWEYTDFQPGLRFALGLSVAASDRIAFDFSLGQVLNHISGREMLPLMPPVDPYRPFIWPYRKHPTGAYNATRLEFVVRIGL